MEATEQVAVASEFFDEFAREAVTVAEKKGKGHVIVDFSDLASFSIELAEDYLDDPENTLQAMSHALTSLPFNLPHNCQVRVKNVSRTVLKEINKIRAKDIGKLLSVEGMIKQKSGVKAYITLIRFECGHCGNIIPELQLDEMHVKKPKVCRKCAGKTYFKEVGRDMVDVFSMMLEEIPDINTSGNKLETVRVLARGSMTTSSMERKLYQGSKVRVTGPFKEKARRINGKVTNILDWYVEANYIELLDSDFNEVKYDASDIVEFQKLSKRKDVMEILRHAIFHDIFGYQEETEGVLLQLFGGITQRDEKVDIRGNIHILLIGDAGTAKSSILKLIHKFSPKARYVAGTGVSGVGLTGAAVKDELLGGWTMEAGAIPLSSGGILCLDELDKVGDDNKKALHEPMEQLTVSIDKGAVHATLPAETSILAAANPKYGKYSSYESLYSQIDLSPTLISRFDLVYPIRSDALSDDHNEQVLNKIMTRGTKAHKKQLAELEYSREFLLKYIAYAKTLNPEMSKEAQVFVRDKFMELLKFQRQHSERTDIVNLTPRHMDALRRLATALARAHLREEITSEDASRAYEKLMYSVRQLGLEPDSGNELEEFAMAGQKHKVVTSADLKARIVKIIRSYGDQNKGEPILESELKAVLSAEGFDDPDKIDEYLHKLKNTGDIYSPRTNTWGLIK